VANLEEYLGDAFRVDRQETETLDRHLSLVAATFTQSFAAKHWPYEFRTSEETLPQSAFSQGTVAMSVTAVGRLIGECNGGPPHLFANDQLRGQWDVAITALVKNIKKRLASSRGRNPANVRSTTFGDNNPLTLSHITELVTCLGSQHIRFKTSIRSSVEEAIQNIRAHLSGDSPSLKLLDPGSGRYQKNAFVPVRAMRAVRDIHPNVSFINLKQFFESGLHDQLSFSAIPDSRFDPAEMLFCLEGLLICHPEAVECSVFERVLQVLREKQDTSAHWRPNKPFMASATGHIVLPLSVEGANSLIRSVDIMDRERSHDLFASKSMPLLRRFWNWLVARALRFERDGEQCIGWHSEHVNEPDLVHIWDTCLVTDFMIAYRALLGRHVAYRSLSLSGVKVREPRPLAEALPTKAGGAPHDWKDVLEDREPLTGKNPKHTVYQTAGDKFVAPRLAGRGERQYSMLLYGPPGTGKSTLAELMADTLKWPLLTVTVSDFLGSGGALVESRAKAIFQMLENQKNCVILFDEVDSFLLDRDSKFYRDQETLFKFLTPGMLTKINDLRAKRESLFIIATNYANRIDPAIKRIGRIDSKLLLLPPDLTRRRRMLEKAVNGLLRLRTDKSPPSGEQLNNAAKAALYLGWSDILAAVRAWADAGKSMEETLDSADRSTGPSYYGRRFPAERPFRDELLHEVQALHDLAAEVDALSTFRKHFVAAAVESAPGDAAVEADSGDFVDSLAAR
jgi:hypothetical protein